LSPVPGSPYSKWTPDRDEAGESWGWTFQSEDWTVEISKCVELRLDSLNIDCFRPNIKQYIRYVQL
jgi:hypothetical protein